MLDCQCIARSDILVPACYHITVSVLADGQLSALIFSLMPLCCQKQAMIRKEEFYEPYDNSHQPAEAKYEPKSCPHFCPENVACFFAYLCALQTRFFHGSKQYLNLIRLLPCEQSGLGPYRLQYRLP